MNYSLFLALLVMGFTFTVTQVAVIRELLVVFLGNELSIAIIAADWLILEAAGSFLIGRRIKSAASERKYACLQMLLSLLLPATIYAIRGLREIMGLSVGEAASLPQIFLWTAVILAPLGIVDGLLFALGCALYSDLSKRRDLTVGRVYLYEGLGAGLGGILYTFVLILLLGAFEVALLLGTVNLISALLLLSLRGEKDTGKTALRGLLWSFLALNILLFTLSGAGGLEKQSLERQWKGLKVLASRWSPYGNVTVGQRDGQLTFFASGTPVCTAPIPNIAFAEEKVHYPLLAIPSPRRVLVIGGGPGGVIAEVLKHPATEVHYTEIDPLIIRMIGENLTPLTRGELENPRVRIHVVDGRLYVKTAPPPFDAILLNLPLPLTLELNRFYTVEFFTEISRLLSRDGVFALHLPGSETYLSRETRDLNDCIRRSLQAVFTSVYIVPGEVNFFLAFPSPAVPPPSPATLAGRLEERGISTLFFRDRHISLKLEPGRLRWLEDSLGRGVPAKLNRDVHPSGFYYGIAYWNAQFHPGLQVFWGKAADLRLWHVAAPLALLSIGTLIGGKKRRPGWRKGTLVGAVASTGFFGMASSVLFILAFQTLYGHVYLWIGILIASFMAGLALGSWTMNRKLGLIGNPGATLIAAEISIILFALLTLLMLAFLYRPGPGQGVLVALRYIFIPACAGAGFLVGLEFSLAGRLFYRGGEEVVRTAGTLYAADLCGAFVGSLLVGVIFVPVLGIVQTAAAAIFLKATSLAFIRLSGLAKPENEGK